MIRGSLYLESSITEEHREAYNSLIEKKTSSSSSSSASAIVGKQLDTNEFKLKSNKNLSRALTSNSSSTDIVPSTVGNQKLSLSLASSSSFLLFQLNDKFKNHKNNNDDLSVLKQSASRSTTLPSRKINKIKKSNINLESSFLRILRDKNHPIIRTPQKFLSNDECIKGDDGDSENINPQKAITNTSSNNSGNGSSQNEKDTLRESQSYQPNTSYTFPENITKTNEMTINNNVTSNKMNDCPNKLTTTFETENHNPIPLPPRDRNKIMLTNAKRHVRKHPLIIPAFGVTRTLNKVSEMVPVSEHKRLMFPSKSTNSTIISTFNPIISSESQSQVDKNLNHSSLDKYSARTIKVHESDNSSIKIPKIIQETNNSTINNPSQSLSSSIASSVSRKNQNQIHIKDNLSNTMNNKYKNVNKNDIVPFYGRQYENISNIRQGSIDEQDNTDSASLRFELILEDGFDNIDTVPSPEDGLCPFAIQKENYNKQKEHIDIKMSGLYVNEDELRNLDLEKQKLEFLRLRHSKHLKSESEIDNQDDVLARRTDGENVNLEMQQENEQNNQDDKNGSISYNNNNYNNNNNNNNDNNKSNNNETVNEQMLYLQVSDLDVNKNDGDIDDDVKDEANNYYDNVNNASGRNMNNTKSVGKYNSVSCEDLLEFSNTKPKGYERGVDSDEVRIMLKVLGKDVPPERCLETLEFIEWDVHRAIKIIRLQNISLPTELSLREAFLSLIQYDWDVHTTALKLKNIK